MFKGFHYTRHPTFELLAGAVIFIVLLVTTTFVVTSRYDNETYVDSDAPGTWGIQVTGIEEDLNDVTFVDARNGWAIGERGIILHTSNGGATWDEQDSRTNLELTSVEFINADEGWVVGNFGFIAHTADSGESWEQQADQSITLGLNFAKVSFIDADIGYVLTERGGSIFKTINGGETWMREFLSNTSKRTDMIFINSDRGLILFLNGGIFHTFDGARSWELRSGADGDSIGQNGMFFLDEDNGWIAGWRGRKSDVRAGLQFSQFLTDGMVARTTDGGRTWKRNDVRTGRFLWDLTFLDSKIGWAVGSFGSIIYSNDGGVHWESQPTESDKFLRSVMFSDPKNGWAVGDEGTILKFTGW